VSQLNFYLLLMRFQWKYCQFSARYWYEIRLIFLFQLQ